ncbi:MAG: hypothetical protein AAF401_09455 [Pseudomonadota bacterium]
MTEMLSAGCECSCWDGAQAEALLDCAPDCYSTPAKSITSPAETGPDDKGPSS